MTAERTPPQAGPLRRRLLESGLSMADGTALAAQNDPYRQDTPSGHRDGAWLAEQLERAVGPDRRLHLRGAHYALVAGGHVVRPNGQPYINK